MMYQDEEGKEYCLSNPPIAYYGNSSLFITIHGFDYGIDDYAYVLCALGHQDTTYHKLKLEYDGRSYFMLDTFRVNLDDCLRTSI